jgi:primosomal protein N' (replication factor Y)
VKIAKILIPIGVYGCFDYETGGFELTPGNLVKVPFRRGETFGLVMALQELADSNLTGPPGLKKVASILPIPPLEGRLIKFIRWFSDYNIIPSGLVLRLIFSEKFIQSSKIVSKFSYLADGDGKITKKQKEVTNFLKNNFPREYELSELENICSRTVLGNLVRNKILAENKMLKNNENSTISEYFIDTNKVLLNNLSDEQEVVYRGISAAMEQDRKPILLEGITGSGKTEIYFHLFERILKTNDGGQILFMLPEIALTNQFVDRFRQQFRCPNVAVWHSGIGDSTRRQLWNALMNGDIRFVMGARSSLFLPYRNLKLIVIDEEHDASYKQTDNVSYNARNMAVVRAKFEECPIILGSATPSLESLFNVENNKYNYFFLASRFGSSELPKIEIIDLTKDKLKPNSFLSGRLVDEMHRELSLARQVLLFMNRRGYAPVALCNNCGYRFLCPNCDVSLTVYEADNILLCHHCGHRTKKLTDCPACGMLDSIIFFGPGVEKIEREVRKIFPDKNTIIVTSDTVQNSQRARQVLQRIMDGEVDIIIGTQMITKGYDFPNLTLVGVLDADASLFGANFRSAEKTYQLLTQVTGRAGRKAGGSRALVQSHSVGNVIIQALEKGDREIILNFEKESRKIANLPPYGRIAAIVLSGPSELLVRRRMNEIINAMPSGPFEIFGPVPLSPSRLAGLFRFRLVIRTENNLSIRKIISPMLDDLKTTGHVKVRIEVDPYDL